LDKVYRAPEALQGKYSDKSDVFSLGVIVYKLLTLRDPFTEVELESQ
jgi:serine/threonine protein kinase